MRTETDTTNERVLSDAVREVARRGEEDPLRTLALRHLEQVRQFKLYLISTGTLLALLAGYVRLLQRRWPLGSRREALAVDSERFGIVYVDFRTLERVPKASHAWYHDFIARRSRASRRPSQ